MYIQLILVDHLANDQTLLHGKLNDCINIFRNYAIN